MIHPFNTYYDGNALDFIGWLDGSGSPIGTNHVAVVVSSTTGTVATERLVVDTTGTFSVTAN